EVYDAGRGFSDFVQMLKRSGRFDEALVILTADHGEAFGEHDTLSHGRNLNVEEMHVPLIVRFSGGRNGGTQVKERVGLHDLLPTILAEVGARGSFSYQLPGEEMPPGARASGWREGEPFYAELSQFGGNDLDLVAVIDEDGYKRVIDLSVAPRETAARKSLGLWDNGRDPGEAEDLSTKLPARAAYAEQLIARWLLAQKDRRDESAAVAPPRVHLDDEIRQQLRDLGYVGSAGGTGDR
ncbi:MAG: sulfatase-like hydrolase/transferase, partial [Armatimonadetes bacterium]|nr:sulfatase-like hydrolase/transferase [Armatimonadota bacterium]